MIQSPRPKSISIALPYSTAAKRRTLEGVRLARASLISVELGRGTIEYSPRGWLSGPNSSPTLSICCWLSGHWSYDRCCNRFRCSATESAGGVGRVATKTVFQYLSVSSFGAKAGLLIANDSTRLCGHYRTKEGLTKGGLTTFDRGY